MSDNPYDNIESWQYRWAKWGRYAHMTASEIIEETYRDGHAQEAYNGMSYLVTMQHIALMRRLGKVANYIVTPDNSLLLARLAGEDKPSLCTPADRSSRFRQHRCENLR